MLASTTTAFEGPLNAGRDDLLVELLGVFNQHGFAGAAVQDALGGPLQGGQFHLRKDLPLYFRRLREPTPINTLIKLFVLDQPVDPAHVLIAFPTMGLDDLAAVGLVDATGCHVRARVRLSGYNGLLLAHDRYDDAHPSLSIDHVLDVNPTTTTLAALTARRPARRALDIGTGCGVLALLAARHSDLVVAVDTNPRALNFAHFNARLNGFRNVECRQGSLFDPVEGERFDLITCNPPYVISPESRYIFRDGGRRGDGLCEEIVQRAPQYLDAGGYASILCNWMIRDGESWSAPLERWVDASPCDSWLLCSATSDPLTYAAMWNRVDRVGYDDALTRWTGYAAELGIASIGLGAVLLHRHDDGKRVVHADRLPDGSIGPDDVPVERFFRSHRHLSELASDDSLLARTFRSTPDHRLHQTLAVRDGQYVVAGAEVVLESGVHFRGSVDESTTRMLSLCDGSHTLEEIAHTISMKGGGDASQVRQACAAIARRLVASGFLVIDEYPLRATARKEQTNEE